ncbi:MAG: histidine--tRNA ligase [Verrucomicrobia bacterium]|nr:histidine--tRNA ligase [Verrucomicrobiota bacterium]MDA1067946.1 histidine--tRNA ligase [Verrucomicrobiota bacterium]
MFKTLPGFRDFYPEDCAVRNHLFRSWRKTAQSYNFKEYDGPILESLDLFKQKSGDEIVDQLFAFEDKGGRSVALRPEMTPSLARMIAARANALKRPIKWFCIEENFRYERMQKGRLRSFYQFNADIFGEPGVGADAEIIATLIQSLTVMGLGAEDFVIRISDRHLWVLYLKSLGLDEESVFAVLGLIDKLERLPRETMEEKLRPFFNEATEDFLAKVDTLTKIRELDDLKKFFTAHVQDASLASELSERLEGWDSLVNRLKAMGMASFIRIDLGIVRGLAYYTGFVFEAFDIQGDHRAIAGGGRYDHLVKRLGGPDLPAVGFAMGDVVIKDFLEEKGLLPNYIQSPDVYAIISSDETLSAALGQIQLLREAGFSVEYPIRNVGFGKQFKAANESGARWAAIFGEDEVARGVAKIKNLGTGDELEVPLVRLSESFIDLDQS